MRFRAPVTGLVAGLLCLAPAGPAPAAVEDPSALLRRAIAAVCPEPAAPDALARQFEAAAPVSESQLEARGQMMGTRQIVPLSGGAELRIERFAPGGRLRRVSADYRAPADSGPRPTLLALAGGDCRLLHGRRLTYTADGSREALIHLEPDLETVLERQPLNPPVPAGQDPGGIRVAVVDSGVAYTLPFVAKRLARDADGAMIGYDFWEQDARPFDGNPAVSPYFPQRHGTTVASVLLREAPAAALVPYRYPRPDMHRMTDLVRHAAAHDVAIVTLPLGSRSQSEWSAFAEAAQAHPEVLFVVAAGNTGRNLDRHPIWPPALKLDNMIVVTSCRADGHLARGSSWGQETVDLMLPAERVEVTDWRGQSGQAAGTSYAAPRLAALAARLKAANPGWSTQQLKAALVERAEPSPEDPPVTRHGWIPDPAKGP